MKFGRMLQTSVLRDWQRFYVNYNRLKQVIRELEARLAKGESKESLEKEFFDQVESEIEMVVRFHGKKLSWCAAYFENLDTRAASLVNTGHWEFPEQQNLRYSSSTADSDSENESDEESEPTELLEEQLPDGQETRASDGEHHGIVFEEYLYAQKAVMDFERELQLLQDYVRLNREGIRKIVKKFDKRIGTAHQLPYVQRLKERDDTKALYSDEVDDLVRQSVLLENKVSECKPSMYHYEGRKVFTIGCFDLFHRGHENMLRCLREFGTFVVVGVHDDESYFKLKKKKTIQNTQQRVEAVKKFADMVFVIPDTDPTPWIRAMVSEQDVKNDAVCYVRGEDMIGFPGREFVEANMPVFFLPRSEGVSSTLLRTIYHNADEKAAGDAAFAETDATGKPILSS